MIDDNFFIFIGCRKRTGKDTFSDLLIETLKDSHDVWKESMIQHARDSVSELFPLVSEYEKEAPIPEYNNASTRDLIISFVDAGRKYDGNCFNRSVLTRKRKKGIVIIPDLRIDDEINFFNKHLKNKIYVKVDRKNIQHEKTYAEGSLDAYTGWDKVIDNDGTLDDLKFSAQIFANEITGRWL
jgi:hypothetical protein